MGRCKLGNGGNCYYEPKDDGPDQCQCVKPGAPQPPDAPPTPAPQGESIEFDLVGQRWAYVGRTYFPLFLGWLTGDDGEGAQRLRIDYCVAAQSLVAR